MPDAAARILTVNAGSSSLRAAIYDMSGGEQLTLAMRAERIGSAGGTIRIVDAGGAALEDRRDDLRSHELAWREFLRWLRQHRLDQAVHAVGHRIVHGGRAHREAQQITPGLLADLQRLVPIDPEHLPQALTLIRTAATAFPAVPQVACFDTAFHHTMPRLAQMYPLPPGSGGPEMMRYGFHGLSCEYIVQALRAVDPGAADGRLIVAHLGNGASLTAIRGGVSLDTTMGFTPAGGLMMGTRTGDLDPGVLLQLLQSEGMSVAALSRLVTHESGLLGVSGTSADMRDLIGREAVDSRAADAVALFCYIARKGLGSLTTVLGGLETLVFTAGIGEHAAAVRERICAGLAFLGVELDRERNRAHAPIISRARSRVVVRVMKSDEDLMIARHARRLLAARP